MNPEKLSPVRQRLLAVTVLISLLFVAISAVILPYNIVAERYDSKLNRLNEKLATYRAIVRDGETARKQQQMLVRIETANGFYIPSEKPALASAELQRRVKLVIEQSGGSVVSSQMMGEKSVDGVDQVLLRLQMRCGLDELQKVFHSLESQSPVLILDNIFIAAKPATGMITARDKNIQQQLDIRFDVAGFRKPIEASTSNTKESRLVSKMGR